MRIKKCTVVTVSAVLMHSTLALAQSGVSQTDSQSARLEEVLVTAQKRSENIRDVPISITVMSEQFLDEQGITNVNELSQLAPNLVISASPSFSFVTMRGLGSGNNKGFERSVSLAIDGIYYGRQDYLLEALADVKQVEVLRGPQGTLFGKNAIAGALNITTGQATDEFTGKLAVQGGDLNRERARFALAGPLIDGVLNFRVSHDQDKYDGYIRNSVFDLDPADNPHRQNVDEFESARDARISRLKLHALNWIEGLDINFSATRAKVFGNGVGLQLTKAEDYTLEVSRRYDPQIESDNSDHQGSINQREDTNRIGNSYSLQFDYTLSDYLLTAVIGHSFFNRDQMFDADMGPVDALRMDVDDYYAQSTVEFRVASPQGEWLEWVAGAYLFDADIVGNTRIFLNTLKTLEILEAARTGGVSPVVGLANMLGLNNAVAASQNNERFFDQNTRSLALFGQTTWNVTDKLALIAGLRVSKERKVAQGILAYPDASSEGVFNIFLGEEGYDERGDRTEDDVSPKLSVRYTLSDEITVYGTYATAFKAGGYNEQAVTKDNFTFEPEQASTLETGVKTRFYGGAATLNVGLFYTEFDDLQVSLFDGLNFSVGNAATATSYGAEIDGQLIPNSWLVLGGSIAYLHARYDEFTAGQCPFTPESESGDVCDLSGRELSRAPEWEVSFTPLISLSRMIPLLGESIPVDIGVGITMTYRSHLYTTVDLDPVDSMGGHTEVGGGLKFAGLDGDWEVAVSVKNATDKTILLGGNDVPIQPGSHAGVMAGGRRIFAEFTYHL
jgi:iron complex outermembrane receptor protein